MRFSSFVATIVAAAGLTSALPAVENEVVKRASSATYHITEFKLTLWQETRDVNYDFMVKSTSDDPNRRFSDVHCSMSLKADTFVSVWESVCSGNDAVTFSFQPYNNDGEEPGWKLDIVHPYHTVNGLFVDGASRKFPDHEFFTGGNGKKRHTTVGQDKKFDLKVQGS